MKYIYTWQWEELGGIKGGENGNRDLLYEKTLYFK